MSKPSYVFNQELFADGKKVKQQIMDGPAKGLSFSYLEKTDKDFMKISAMEKLATKNFEVTTQKGEKKDTSNMTLDELTKMVKKDAKLSFVAYYLAKRKTKMGRSKRKPASKKTSKVPKKKVSKSKSKVSKKTSKRKGSKKKTSKRKSKK